MNDAKQEKTDAALLASVNWGSVGRTAQRELHNREVHAPAVSAFRWWARRPHSVMGALLDAAVTKYGMALTVADPFSGGGTVAFEALRRGLKTYAQDLYPWPTYGLSTTIKSVDPEAFDTAGRLLLIQLDALRDLYRRKDGRELSHIIRVRAIYCKACSAEYFQYPAPLVSLCSRSAQNTQAYFGCRACGTTSLRNKNIKRFSCDGCKAAHSAVAIRAGCPHCKHEPATVATAGPPSRWVPVLVQEVHHTGDRYRSILRRPLPGDPIADVGSGKTPPSLRIDIPHGIETDRLRANGFTQWADLYTKRQISVLVGALSAIKRLPASKATRDRLALAVIGAAEMPSYISRWDRFHLKQFEGLANHRYSACGIAVESNILAPVGRGTLGLRFNSARKAAQWFRETLSASPKIMTCGSNFRGRRPHGWNALITTGSSSQQALPDNSVHLVLTDPPYHDDVQYGELAQLFHHWLSVYRPTDRVDLMQEAVSNTARGNGTQTFQDTIASCLTESHRTLRSEGALVLTFHNKRLVAWRALAGALHSAGFAVSAIATVHSENGDDHCKRNVQAMLDDVVLECRKKTNKPIKPRVAILPRSSVDKNLIAMGLALAEAVELGQPDLIANAYTLNLAKLHGRRRLIA